MITIDEIPPHANAEVHRRLMEATREASKDKIRSMLLAAGIITAAGLLAAHYREPARRSHRTRPAARKCKRRSPIKKRR